MKGLLWELIQFWHLRNFLSTNYFSHQGNVISFQTTLIAPQQASPHPLFSPISTAPSWRYYKKKKSFYVTCPWISWLPIEPLGSQIQNLFWIWFGTKFCFLKSKICLKGPILLIPFPLLEANLCGSPYSILAFFQFLKTISSSSLWSFHTILPSSWNTFSLLPTSHTQRPCLLSFIICLKTLNSPQIPTI